MKLDTMTKDERSQLLFIETRAVDQGGIDPTRHRKVKHHSETRATQEIGIALLREAIEALTTTAGRGREGERT